LTIVELTRSGETTTAVADIRERFKCVGLRDHRIAVRVESKERGIVEDPVVEEVGDKDVEIFVHYGSGISVILQTEHSEVGSDMMRVRLNFLVGCFLEDISTQLF